MRRPIRIQILLPFTVVLLIAVAVTSVTSSVFAARRSEQAIVVQLNRMISTLSLTSFPWSRNVLDTMKGLSGTEFVVFDEHDRPLVGTDGVLPPLPTRPPESLIDGQLLSLGRATVVLVGERRYFAASVRRYSGPNLNSSLLLLYPVESWERARAEAALPPLIVGGATLGVLFLAAVWLAGRLASRIGRVQQQVAKIADGDFIPLVLDEQADEISDLSHSVNRMALQLQEQRTLLSRTERSRLLGQLAGGLAHQLRNAATGARLAVQIHVRRCQKSPQDDSLEMALRQLSLMEEQMRGLLSLGKTEHRIPVDRKLTELLEEIVGLVSPVCHHHSIVWTHSCQVPEGFIVSDAEGLRTAVVNLILNAIDAAGPAGRVELNVGYHSLLLTFDVVDSGPGPPTEIAGGLFDLFVSGKPEGVGIGLALARQVAEQRGGTIGWERKNGRTHFTLTIPTSPRSDAATHSEGFVPDESRSGGGR